MDSINKKFLHDRLALTLLTVLAALLAAGVSIILLKFDASKNPTTIVAYSDVIGNRYVSGKPIDIYGLALFMLLTAGGAAFISARVYPVRRYLSMFILSSSALLLVLAIRVTWSLISLQ